jgi:hypothetical protein
LKEDFSNYFFFHIFEMWLNILFRY